MGLCFVILVNTGLSLLKSTRPECHIPMLLIRSDGREYNFVKFLETKYFLVGRVEASRVGGWYHMRKVGNPGSWIHSVLMFWSHAAMDFSYWPHVYMVR